MPLFFVSYEGELDEPDRRALDRPGWKLYENGTGHTAAYEGEQMPPVTWRQVVRLDAGDAEEARQLVIEALGREPPRLRVAEARAQD